MPSSGVYCRGGSPRILGNAIRAGVKGSEASGGHGIHCWDASTPEIRRNRISGRTGHGILCEGRSTVEIADNTIVDNSGGGIVLETAEGNVSGNRIERNRQGGVVIRHAFEVELTNNLIVDNDARDGAGVFVDSSGRVVITNNTVSNNRASRRGGGAFFAGQGTALIMNTIVFDNTAPEGSNVSISESAGAVVVSHFSGPIRFPDRPVRGQAGPGRRSGFR